MSSDPAGADGDKGFAIRVRDVSKHYIMFNRPEDRFKQMVVPRLERMIGRQPRRYFRDFAALNGVSFDVRRGETVGIVGRNGSGKSTLLQIVCGTLRPTAGTVEVNGRVAALLELGAGFNPEFTGRENVFLNASILGVPREEMAWRFDDIARFADIGPFIDQPVKTYSSGMYVRLAFATAINVDPDILVVDEALSVGDEAFQRKCFARIESIKDKGGTILFVSHGAQTIVQLCTRAILFDAGEKILEGRPKTVVSQYQRLVNASPAAAQEIRTAIIAILPNSELQVDSGEEGGLKPVPVEGNSNAGNAPGKSMQPSVTLSSIDGYDPSFVSDSRVEYENNGATIEDVKLRNFEGKLRNTLQSGKEYTLSYKVLFDRRISDIAFGFTIATKTGLRLAGIGTSLNKSYLVDEVKEGQCVDVSFTFRCILLPGTYFVTVGCSGVVTEDRIFLHRIIDAIPFRVLSEGGEMATGYFDIGARPETTIV